MQFIFGDLNKPTYVYMYVYIVVVTSSQFGKWRCTHTVKHTWYMYMYVQCESQPKSPVVWIMWACSAHNCNTCTYVQCNVRCICRCTCAFTVHVYPEFGGLMYCQHGIWDNKICCVYVHVYIYLRISLLEKAMLHVCIHVHVYWTPFSATLLLTSDPISSTCACA